MTMAFVSFAALALRRLPAQTLTRAPSVARIPPTVVSSQRPRMQCTPTGEVPDLTQAIMNNMEKKITDSLKPTKLEIIPTIGDPNGAHVEIEVVSDHFEGMSAVKRHQVVYKAIWEELSGPVHAVDKLVTKTPAEASS